MSPGSRNPSQPSRLRLKPKESIKQANRAKSCEDKTKRGHDLYVSKRQKYNYKDDLKPSFINSCLGSIFYLQLIQQYQAFLLFLYHFDSFQFDILHNINTMDSDDEGQISTSAKRGRSNLESSAQHRFSHLQKNRSKGSQKPAINKVYIALAVLVFIALASVLKISSISGKVEALQAQNYQLQGLVDKFESRIKLMESKLRTATLLANGNNSKVVEDKKIATKLDGINQTALIPYIEKQFESLKLTVNFLHEHNRESYYYQKVDFLRGCSNAAFLRGYQKAKTSFMQSLNNFKLPHSNINIERERNQLANNQYQRISKEYDLNLPELPFCIVVPTINNARNFRYEYNLQSMINLDYKNFKIVIIDDGSTDHTPELILKWIDDNDITHNIVVIKNEKRMTAVPNIHLGVTKHCAPEDIVVLVDGDDELLGRYALKIFNHIYQKSKADIVWSNHLQFYTHTRQVYRGWSFNYTNEEKQSNRYRDVPQKISHLRSFKAKLFLSIKEEDLKDNNGEWYTSTYDEVICLPILEMSCGRSYYVEEFLYLYNFGIGTNDLQVDKQLQKNIADEVKFKRKKYTCLNE